MQISLNQKRSTIIIISLWIAAILTLFCISIAYRVNIGLRLTKLYRDSLKARAICEGALFRIIKEKIDKDEAADVDYFAESWSNKVYEEGEEKESQPYFKDFPLGEGIFTISYNYRETIDSDLTTFYGMQDEQSKFDINKIEGRQAQFEALLSKIKSEENPDDLTNNLIEWKNNHAGAIHSLEELEHIPGFTRELLYTYDKNNDGSITSDEIGLLEYITIYGNKEGKININTASKEMLEALGFSTEAAGVIIDYRYGDDKVSKEDDGITDKDKLISYLEGLGFQILPNIGQYLVVKSSIYRAKIEARVRNVKKILEAVLEFNPDNNTFQQVLYWHEN